MPETDVKTRLLEAAKPHVPFDGWSGTTLRLAAAEAGMSRAIAEAACPRGAVDLALAYHEAGDAAMVAALDAADLTAMRFRDRVAFAVRTRLELIEDRELVRRSMTLFALPHYAGVGSRALWHTADCIWTALGDSSRDINWYTKRATLSGVCGATVLYWLGDESEGQARTWEFLDRRIEDIMQIEKVKAKARENRLVAGLMSGPLAFLSRVTAPENRQNAGMPGRWRTRD
jgi:ubiquinone biosynthesis protein COQ9